MDASGSRLGNPNGASALGKKDSFVRIFQSEQALQASRNVSGIITGNVLEGYNSSMESLDERLAFFSVVSGQ